jgi:hypothetical protein
MHQNTSYLICNMPPAAPDIRGWSLSGACFAQPRRNDGQGMQIGMAAEGGLRTGQSSASGGRRAG